MYGTIIGDIVGSTYEYEPVETKDFALFPPGSEYTDDSIMAIAVAAALLQHFREGRDLHAAMVDRMRCFGRLFPSPLGAYGLRFQRWLKSKDPEPYYSCGNGSAMRCGACGLIARSLEEALQLARVSAEVTHNHPEGILGAQATAAAVYLARTGSTKEEIGRYVEEEFYDLRPLAQIKPGYHFDATCQGTVPEAIQAFLESESFENAIRNTVWLGGDADTMGAITGAIAWAYYGRDGLTEDMQAMKAHVKLPGILQDVVDDFEGYRRERTGDGR